MNEQQSASVSGIVPGALAGGSPAVRQAFQVIDVVADAAEPSRLRDIVEATGLAKSTVHRLTGALVDLEVLRSGDDGFRLGQRLVKYGNAVVDDTSDLIGMFYASIADVQERLDETIQLGVFSEPEVSFVAFVDTTRPVRLATSLGRSLPAHASATGKAILAFSPDDVVERVLDAPLRRLTPHTITSAARLRSELDLVRARGWARESEESTRNLSCVAAPVLGSTGEARAAVTICVPESTLSSARIEQLSAAAITIAERLGAGVGSIDDGEEGNIA